MAVAELANTVMNRDNMIAFVAAAASFATIVTLVSPLLKDGRLDKRIQDVSTYRDRLRQSNRTRLEAESRRGIRTDSRGPLRRVVDQLQLQKLLLDPKLSAKLMQAGFRGQRPVTVFYFARMITPIVMFVGALIYLFTVNDHDQSSTMRLAGALGAGFIGLQLPSIYLSNIAQKRRASIMLAFPDALDLMLICVEAGMSIEAAFQKVAGEIGTSSIELAEELSMTTAELSYLNDRRAAFDNLGKRTNHPGVKAVSTALIQAERYGTPLGNALRVMAKENRDMRLATAEKKAASLPAKLTVPMIVFFLPVLFVVILGPAILRFKEMGPLGG